MRIKHLRNIGKRAYKSSNFLVEAQARLNALLQSDLDLLEEANAGSTATESPSTSDSEISSYESDNDSDKLKDQETPTTTPYEPATPDDEAHGPYRSLSEEHRDTELQIDLASDGGHISLQTVPEGSGESSILNDPEDDNYTSTQPLLGHSAEQEATHNETEVELPGWCMLVASLLYY